MPFQDINESGFTPSAPPQVPVNNSPDSVGGSPRAAQGPKPPQPFQPVQSSNFAPVEGKSSFENLEQPDTSAPTLEDWKTQLAPAGVKPGVGDWRAMYAQEQAAQANRTLGQKIQSFGQGIKSVFEPFIKAIPEIQSVPADWEHHTRAKRIFASIPEMVTGAAQSFINWNQPEKGLLSGAVVRPYEAMTDTDEDKFQRWYLDQLQQHPDLNPTNAQYPTAITPDVLRGGVEPLPNLSEAGVTALTFALPEAGLAAAKPLAATRFMRPLVEAGEIAKMTPGIALKSIYTDTGLANKIPVGTLREALPTVFKAADALTPSAAGMAGAVQKTGDILDYLAGLPKKAAEKAVEAIAGPEAAEGLSKLTGGKELTATTAATALGVPGAKYLAGAKASGMALSNIGAYLKRLAEADPASPFGRLATVAADPTAPSWMRAVSKLWVTRATGEALNAAKTGATAATHGTLFGAGYGLLTGQDPWSAAGVGTGYGLVGGAMGHPSVKQGQILDRLQDLIDQKYQQHIAEGVTPETMSKVGNDAMSWAVTLESLYGNQLKVKFGDKNSLPPELAEQGGAYDADAKTLYVNVDKRDPSATVLHEMMHPIYDDFATSHGDVAAAVNNALAEQGKNLNDVKMAYADALLKPHLDAEGITDPAARQAASQDWVQNQDAKYAQMRGNPDAWIHSEILSEAAARALYGEHPILDVVNRGITEKAVEGMYNALRGLGVDFKSGPKPDTVLPGFENVIDSPSLRKLTYSLVRELKKTGAPQVKGRGVPVTKATIGQHPGIPVKDLGNGVRGNDFMKETAPGSGRFEQRPRAETSRIFQGRRQEVNQLYPNDANLADESVPLISRRRTPSGLIERSGTQLGDAFYNTRTFGNDTKAFAKDLEDAIQKGEARAGWYQSIGKSDKTGEWHESVEKDAGNIEAQYRRFIPVDFVASKAGNLLVRNYDLNSFENKAKKWAERHGDISLDMWGGDLKAFENDVATYLENHKEGRPGETGLGTRKRDTINAFLVGGNRSFENVNPLRKLLSGKDRAGVIRSFRLDRMQTVEPTDTSFVKPSYRQQLQNMTPGGLRAGQYSPQVRDTNKEHIIDAALRTPDGKIWRGPTHIHAAMGIPDDMYKMANWDDGFYTSKGRFVDRDEAKRIAMAADQIDQSKARAVEEELATEPGYARSSRFPLESITFDRSRSFSPAEEDARRENLVTRYPGSTGEPWWKQGAPQETETSRHSSYAGDAESGVILHSAKQRATVFLPPGAKAANFLKRWNAISDESKRDNLVENFFGSGKEYSPQIKEDSSQLTSKGWIMPGGKFVGLEGQLHSDYLNKNAAEFKKKYGVDFAKYPNNDTEDGPRIPALNKGFVRSNYERNSGTLTIEANQKYWTKAMQDSVFNLVADNIGKIDHMRVALLDDKARVKKYDQTQLFQYEAGEKLNHLPLISESSSGRKAYSPASMDKFPQGASADDMPEASGQYWMTKDGKFIQVRDHQDLADQMGFKDVYDLYHRGLLRTIVRPGTSGPRIWLNGVQDDPTISPKQAAAIEKLKDRGWEAVRGNGQQYSPALLDHRPTPQTFSNEKDLSDNFKKGGWAVLTGTREAAGAHDAPENVNANAQLQNELNAYGYNYVPVSGYYKGVDQGPNFLVTGIRPTEALNLGKKYGQESVLVPEGLLHQDNTVVPVDHGATVTGDKARSSEFYTEVPGGGAISLGLNFKDQKPYEPKTYVIRHGETDFNVNAPGTAIGPEQIRGWIDVPLNEKGRQQAHETAEKMKNTNVDTIVSSDLGRAMETANIIGKAIGAQVVPEFGLRPWNLGDFEGQPVSEVQPKMQHYIDNPDEVVPNGESFNQFKKRFIDTYKKIEAQYPDNVGVLTHYRGTKLLDAWRKAGGRGYEIDQARFNSKNGGEETAGMEPYPKGIPVGNSLKVPVTIEGPDGTQYKATYDGQQDLSMFGRGVHPQFTAREDIPGLTSKDSTTYLQSIEKKGFKVNGMPMSPATDEPLEKSKRIPNPRLVTPPGELTGVEKTVSDLARQELRQRVQLLPTTDERVRVRRAMQRGFKEMEDVLKKQEADPNFDAGAEWYKNDVAQMESTTKEIFPETKDPTMMGMFKLMLAGLSGGQTPTDNFKVTCEAFSQYLKTGRVPYTSEFRKHEGGEAKQLGRNARTTADLLNRYLVQLGGEEPLLQYMITVHPETIKGLKNAYGALDMGPKFGRFFLNLSGHANEVTIDLWATRIWNRWMGTPFRQRENQETGKKTYEIAERPAISEHNAMMTTFQRLADKINKTHGTDYTPMDVQAMLWYQERNLHGAEPDSFGAAAEKYITGPQIHKGPSRVAEMVRNKMEYGTFTPTDEQKSKETNPTAYTPGVFGFVGRLHPDGEIVTRAGKLDQVNHSKLPSAPLSDTGSYALSFRYNTKTHSLYWWGEPSEDQKENVVGYFKKKGYPVKKNINLYSSKEDEQNLFDAHGVANKGEFLANNLE